MEDSPPPQSPSQQPGFLERAKAFADKTVEVGQQMQQRAADYQQQRHDAAVARGAQDSRVVVYKSEREMARGMAHMTGQGWQVAGQSSYTPRKGLLRTLAGGFLFFNRKPVTTVTYTRPIR